MIALATVVSKDVIPDGPVSDAPNPDAQLSSRRAFRAPSDVRPAAPVVRIVLSVSEWFRGNFGNSVVVQTDTSDCAYPFETGHQYLVFAIEFQGKLTVNICTATRPAKMAATTIRQLRALRDGTALPDLFGFAGTHAPDTGPGGWEQVQPVPGLTVTAVSEKQEEYRTYTADDGSYAFQGLPAGRYEVRTQVPAGRLALWGGSADHGSANVWRGNTCPVNFEVFYDGRINGTIVGRDGQAVSGSVFAIYEGPEELNAAPIGSQVKEGHFEISRMWPGRYRLVFQPSARPAARTGLIYYPGTTVAKDATPIAIGEGTHVDDLLFVVF